MGKVIKLETANDKMQDRVFFDLPKGQAMEDLQNAYAYLYLWCIYEDENGEPEKYIGYHGKTYDGTYKHSSESIKFLSKMKNAKKVVFTILDYGNVIDMSTKETELLQYHNAKSMDDFFNKSSGGGRYSKTDRWLTRLYEAITSGECDEYIQEHPCSYYHELIEDNYRIQSRDYDDEDHKKNITIGVNLENGNTSHLLVHLLEDHRGKGKHTFANGYHSAEGVWESNYSDSTIKGMFIPKKLWSKLKPYQLISLCNMLNPRKKHKDRRKETGIGTMIKEMIVRKGEGIEFGSALNIALYTSEPYNFTKPEVDTLVSKATKEFNKNHARIKGRKYINWTKDKRDKEVEKHKKSNKDAIVTGFGSGNFDIRVIMLDFIRQTKNKRKKEGGGYKGINFFDWIITHPVPDGTDPVDAWATKLKNEDNKLFMNWIEKEFKVKIRKIALDQLENDGVLTFSKTPEDNT